MTGVLIAAAAWIVAVVLICSAIADIWNDGRGGQAAAPPDGQSHETDAQADGRNRATLFDRSDWLPATLPPTPPMRVLSRPRVCGGRVAGLQTMITVCDAAGWPVRSYHAGVCWPAQEGTT